MTNQRIQLSDRETKKYMHFILQTLFAQVADIYKNGELTFFFYVRRLYNELTML